MSGEIFTCETETENNFPKIGQKVFFDEYLEAFENHGMIIEVKDSENLVFVQVDGAVIRFDLDGSSWSHCGCFKREQWTYQGE